jgi:hypothetical protein
MSRLQNDVLSLLVQLDIPDFQYWEFHRYRQRLAAADRWPLVINTDRALADLRGGGLEETVDGSLDDEVRGIPVDEAVSPPTDLEEPVSLEIESPYAESTVRRRERKRATTNLALLKSVQKFSKNQRS